MIKEARRLYRLGFAIHWLRPNSKMPIESGWQKGPRKKWDALEDKYTYGLNVGVRLGRASRFEDGTYLAVVDCDVKSDNAKHEREMITKLKELVSFAGPQVSSGRGNGSRHIYVRVKEPKPGYRYCQSNEKVRVMMPGTPPSNSDRQNLKDHEIKAGLRWRAAWEISVMGEGQQVVLPPSIHPDTGKAYEWAIPMESFKKLPVLLQKKADNSAGQEADLLGGTSEDFTPVEVDLISANLPDSIVNMILSGKGCSDRSASLFSVAIAMYKERFSDDQILSVLTDRSTYLGKCAYAHANTTSRKRAASWVKRYTLHKVKNELSAKSQFAEVVKISDDVEAAEIKRHEKVRLEADEGWKDKIEREGTKAGAKPKQSLHNMTLILANAVGEKLFKHDLFAGRTFYGMDPPWDGKKDEAITDTDAVLVKHWMGQNFRFEPSVNLVFEAVSALAKWNSFHPVREMLAALPEWDGEPRIAGWLKTHFNAKGPDHYLDEVFYKFLCGMISRVMVPGCQFDWMPILEGPQGVGKSTFARLLAGDKYFVDWLPELSDKDAAQLLQGVWVVEMGELASLKKQDIETVKAFVTRRVDKFRPSYGRTTVEASRQCVFMGSTNSSEYLRDDTGNRRFVPLEVGRCDFKAIKRDRNQLLAEAYWSFNNSMISTLEIEGEAGEYSKQMQASRMVKDDSFIMAEQIQTWMKKLDKQIEDEKFDENKFKLLSLFGGMGPLVKWRAEGRTIALAGKALRSLGYESRKVKGNIYWRGRGRGRGKNVDPSPP